MGYVYLGVTAIKGRHPFACVAALRPAMRPKTAPDIRPVLLAYAGDLAGGVEAGDRMA
jgi:hypothetical protein